MTTRKQQEAALAWFFAQDARTQLMARNLIRAFMAAGKLAGDALVYAQELLQPDNPGGE